jgi:intein/homing endonuclease
VAGGKNFDKLSDICWNKLKELKLEDDLHTNRLKEELFEINKKDGDESSYFLALHSRKIKVDKNEHNLFVCYLLGICSEFDINKNPAYTDADLPDIDTDFHPDVREYLKDDFSFRQYGKDHVCNITTYQTYDIKSALIDMARVLGEDRDEIIGITTQIEKMKNDDGNDLTFDGIEEDFKKIEKKIAEKKQLSKHEQAMVRLNDYRKSYPAVWDAAKQLVAAPIDWKKFGYGKPPRRKKSMGMHASGLIIAGVKLSEFVPLVTPPGSRDQGLQASGWVEGLADTDCSSVGLIKFDYLSLEANAKIAECNRLIMQRHGLNSICALPGLSNWSDTSYLNDPKALAAANAGDLKGIFQFDSNGIRKLAKKGGVTSFDDLVAYSALYRPGPMDEGMHDEYCDRKNGKKSYEIHPLLVPFLGRTYGVLCIHEDTLIALGDGREIPIKSIKAGDRVHSLNRSTNEIEVKECHGCAPTRVCNGIKITLENGMSVTLTPDHKVLTPGGMRPVETLTDGDLVAVSYNVSQKDCIDEDLAPWLGSNIDIAYLLGLLSGDGSINKNTITISTGIKENHDRIMEYLQTAFPVLNLHEYFHCRSWYVTLSCSLLLNDSSFGSRKTKLHKLFEDLGMKQSCLNKTVPNWVLQCSEEVRYSYLAGLIDSDGYVGESTRGMAICHISSSSFGLKQGVRRLCQMMGCPVTIYDDHIYLWNTDLLERKISPYLRIKSFDGLVCKSGHGCGRVYLTEVLSKMFKGESQRGFCNRIGVSRKNLFHNNHQTVTRKVAKKAGVDFGDILFYRISSIDKIEKAKFYGMSVSDHHNLIANGIVIKNCYQEQIMRALNVIGGIPLKDCEAIRKAISKKKVDKFKPFKDMFIENGKIRLNVDVEYLINFWAQIEAFAGYGFNLSHAVAYTYISSRQLWQKVHYPLEFFTSALRSLSTGDDRIMTYIQDARKKGVCVNKIDMNKSKSDFEIIDDQIYYGFSKIKGIGMEPAKKVVELQPYKGFQDFLEKFGTEAKVVHRLIGLRVFEEKDPHTLYLYYEAYKKAVKAEKDRKQRNKNSLNDYMKELSNLIGPNRTWEHGFDDNYFGKLRSMLDDKDWIRLCTVKKKYDKCVETFAEKSKNIKDITEKLSLDKFVLPSHSNKTLLLDKTAYKTYKAIKPILKDPDGSLAETTYYGFPWKSDFEIIPSYRGFTFDEYEIDILRTEPGTALPVEVKIMTKEHTVSRSGKLWYWKLRVVDALEPDVLRPITVWEHDYDRFESMLQPGNIVRMRLLPPEDPYPNYSLEGVKPWEMRGKNPYGEDPQWDYRVVLLSKGARKKKFIDDEDDTYLVSPGRKKKKVVEEVT